MYKIKEMPTTERPRERLKNYGVESLSDSELLAIILKTGTKNKNVLELSYDILKRFSLQEITEATLPQLIKIEGIGEVKALEILTIIELGKRIYKKEKKNLQTLSSSRDIFLSTRYLFSNKTQEHFYALYFNTKQELLEIKLLFKGTVNESTVHPRELFKAAYSLSATYIVCIHNHPSNDTTPSKADLLFTESIIKTGQIHGIKIVDHIIVGEDNYYSFYEHKKTFIKEGKWRKIK